MIKSLKIKNNKKIQKYLLPVCVCASIVSLSLICEATSTPPAGSSGVIKAVIGQITDIIKVDGKRALQLLCAAAGGLGGAKTLSWQPVLVGIGGAGMLEMIFTAIG